MAKQRRASARSVRSRPALLPAAPARPLTAPPQPLVDSRIIAERTPEKAPRPGYLEAVGLYEQGVAAIQAHDYSRASSVLRSVLFRYPEEKELHERVRLYLNVCDRHMTPRAVSPSTPEERVFAATLAVNAGNYDEALEHLRRASSEAPDHDHALYMLASVLALRDQVDEAVPILLRAIELNSENRAMARHDPDLDALRQYDSVRVALEASTPSKAERRKAHRRSR
jgi:tetratricopeptide (TPR) repeat protein